MYEIDRQSIMKKKKRNYQKLHSLKIFNFNSNWQHQYPNQSIKNQSQPINIVLKNQYHKDTNKNSQQLTQQIDKQTNSKYQISNYSQNSSNQISLLNSQIYPKKKALSQLQSYKKLDFSNLKARFSKPTEQIQQQNTMQDNYSGQNNLVIKSKKITGLKLPEIKTTARQNQIIKKVKLQNLKVINIQERIKTMKLSPQKSDQQSFISQGMSQIIKNKNKIIQRFNKKLNCQPTPQRKFTNKISSRKDPLQQIQKIKKKVKQIIDVRHKSQRDSIQTNNPQSSYHKQSQYLQNKTVFVTLQDQQNKIKLQQKIKQKQIQLPFIQIYDKKMKIGRKKKSQQDRIRAMLLKTLQKTKGTDYVAQRGSSQYNNSSLTPHKKSLSKNSKEGSKQKEKLILINQIPKAQTIINNEPNINKKFSIKKTQLQKIRKQISNNNTQRNMTNHRISQNLQNRKFVQMVRQNQNKQNHKKSQKLQEIKQEKTINHDDSSISQQQKMKNSNQGIKNDKIYQNQYMKSLKKQIQSQEVSENQFIPTARRQYHKNIIQNAQKVEINLI